MNANENDSVSNIGDTAAPAPPESAAELPPVAQPPETPPTSPAKPPLPRRNHHRPQGKVARLPLEIRNLVNQALRNGRRYREVVALLHAQGFPGFTEHNISNWAKGAYREWLAVQERFEARRPLSDKVQAVLGQLRPDGRSDLADLNESMLALYFHELLQACDTPDLAEKSDDFLRLAKVLASCMIARAQRQRVELERLNYELEVRKIEWQKSRPNRITPDVMRQIEAAAKLL